MSERSYIAIDLKSFYVSNEAQVRQNAVMGEMNFQEAANAIDRNGQ